MLTLILIAVVATNIAVAVMYIMMRRNMAAAPAAPAHPQPIAA